MSRFVRYSLFALIALVGPRWLISDASASYRLSLTQDPSAGYSTASSSGAASESPFESANPNPNKPVIHRVADMPANNGAGSVPVSSSVHAAGGVVGLTSEMPAPPIPFVTRMRLARDRVAAISRPSSVFEPPRVG